MTEVSKTEQLYKLYDKYNAEKIILTLFIGAAVGFSTFLVMDSYQETKNATDLNVSQYYDNETGVCWSPEYKQPVRPENMTCSNGSVENVSSIQNPENKACICT